ncbi:MAG: ABC transporter ATP-binding protein [Candidatus Bathyarchaeota archaeon]|nr:ABC transporter ATP-binding protein [Candidatus Bathyarchaeota archaeon]
MMLEVDNVTSGYGTLVILHNVSIHVNEKEIVCIVGPNGAGKSTLLKTIFGIIKPRQGRITFKEEDISGAAPSKILRKGISYVPQARSIFPYMTVLENLEMGAYILNDDELIKKRIMEIYNKFPILEERKSQKAGNMSGGEQRMLEIGRCLILDPEIILLDEPTLGLAPKVSKILFEKIKELNDFGISMLIVEQNARMALQISDLAYVLELGRNRFEGTGQSLLGDEKIRKLYLGGLDAHAE